MHTPEAAQPSPPKFRIRNSQISGKIMPPLHSCQQNATEDIYLNIEITPTFTTSHQNSLKIFNRKLQQGLNQRLFQKPMHASDSNKQKSLSFCNSIKKMSQKCLIIDEESKNETKTQFSISNRKKEKFKKYSLDMNPQLKCKKTIFQIPLIKEDVFDENNLLEGLIGSQSSKGLIERLLKRKKPASSEEQKSAKKLFRYPLNRKLLNKVCNKSQKIKSEFASILDQTVPDMQQKCREQPTRVQNRGRHHRFSDLPFLSPPKRKTIKSKPHEKANIHPPQKQCGSELGPWEGHPTLDI